MGRQRSGCVSAESSFCDEPSHRRIDGLNDLVRDYKDLGRPKVERELREFRDERSLRRAVRRAGLAQDISGKKLRHQYLIPPAVLREWSRILVGRVKEIGACRQFPDLHEILRETGRTIRGIGRLTAYDTALRIGAFRGLHLPPDAVYLHAGAKIGAKAMGFVGRERAIPGRWFPKEFRSLEPYEIEHCLCVYRRELRRLRRAGKIRLPAESANL
jgi:hypothetical protein